MMIQTEDDRYVRDMSNRALCSKRKDLLAFRERRQKEQRINEYDDRLCAVEAKLLDVGEKMDRILTLLEKL